MEDIDEIIGDPGIIAQIDECMVGREGGKPALNLSVLFLMSNI